MIFEVKEKAPKGALNLFVFYCQRIELRFGMSQDTDDFDQCVFHLLTRNHNINHTVVAQVFCSLETIWQFFTDGLLNYTRASKTYQAALLRDINITQHRK